MSRFALAAVLLLATGQIVRADFILNFGGVRAGSLSGNVSYSYTGTDNAIHSGSINGIYFAEISMTAVGQGAGGSNLTFRTFCVDLFHGMRGEFLVRETPLTTNPGANGAPSPAPLGGWFGGGMAYLYNQYLGLGNAATATIAAQYQLAIWRLTLGAGATLTTGNASLDAEANALYAAALLNLDSTGIWLQKVNGPYGQGVLFPPSMSRLVAPAVPAPGHSVLLSSGGLCFGFIGYLRGKLSRSLLCVN